MSKKRKRNNNKHHKNNNNSKNKKKKKRKIKPKNRHFLGPKIALAVLLGALTFSDSKNYDLENLIGGEQRIVQTRVAETSVEQKYLTWKEHYDFEGILIEDLEKKSKKVQDFLMKIRTPVNAQELVFKFVNDPYDDFLRSDKNYSDYSLNAMCMYYFGFNSERNIDEQYKKFFGDPSKVKEKIKGSKEIEDHFVQKYQELIKKNDDDLAYWALNAAYYITRKNLKSSNFIDSNSKEDLEKAFDNNLGDCEILTYFTKETYLTILRELKKKHLSKRLISNMGFLLDKKRKITIGHHWLTFKYKGEKKLVETNSFNDDFLFNSDEKYDADKEYIKESFIGAFYVPLFSTTFAPGTDKDYSNFRKINILPKEIEEEIEFKPKH